MRILADLHTHTMVSQHAYSTLRENCLLAREHGMELVALTDHAYDMPDGANDWHFGSMWVIPRKAEGVWVLRGAEANIMDYDGRIDLNESDRHFLDFVIASLHGYCIKPRGAKDHTAAYDAVLSNPCVDTLGHPASSRFPFDEEYIVKRCAETGKCFEINAHAMLLDPPAAEINLRLLRLAKKHGATVTIGSDAHICYDVGALDSVCRLLEEEGFPEELVLNAHPDEILRRVNEKAWVRDKFPV